MHYLGLFILISAHLAAAEPTLVQPDPTTVLVLDTRVIEQAENAHLVLGTPVKDPHNPLLPADQPWENATNNYYPNVLWDAEKKLWKLWYKDVLADKEVIAQMENPSTVHDVGWYLLYASSKDGLTWQKPALGLHKFGGKSDNNAVARDCPNVGVFKDLHDPDPARRYKMVFDVGLGKPRASFSADGIHWSAPQEMLGFSAQQGDTHNNAFFDTRSGKYLWFTKLYLGERLVTRLESDDFLHWKSSGMVLRSTLDEGRTHQTYALTVFPYGNIYLGYVMMYHLGTGRTVDCELAWSPDSIHWQRVQPGVPFLKLGEKGSYDGGCIYAQAGPPVAQDGQIMLYYGGSPTIHLGWKRSGSLCLARLREDGFAAYEALDKTKPAGITTSRLKATANDLTMIADGDAAMEKLPEKDGTFRLKITLAANAKVYSIRGATLVNTDLPTPKVSPLPHAPPHAPLVFAFDQDAQGWQGVDKAVHHPEGYLTIERAKNLRPFAHATPLPGDWPILLGGDEVTWSARIRAAASGGHARFELFANEVAQWTFEKLPPLTTEWQTLTTTLRHDWTDEQAKAAGWVPSPYAYSWRETIRHAGKLVITSTEKGGQSFDLDDVSLAPR
ncbi:MAG: hypothetical protein U0984_14215 [Prosthecobacter sp.]|nr:hypothetical protein [Prosthecobacter sp.]